MCALHTWRGAGADSCFQEFRNERPRNSRRWPLSLSLSVARYRVIGRLVTCQPALSSVSKHRQDGGSSNEKNHGHKSDRITPALHTHTHTRSGPHLRAGAHIKCREILRKRHTCPNGQRYSPGLFSFMDLLASACNGIHTPCYDREKGR